MYRFKAIPIKILTQFFIEQFSNSSGIRKNPGKLKLFSTEKELLGESLSQASSNTTEQ